MLRSIGDLFPNAVQIRDSFHVNQKVSKGVKALEEKCYHLIRIYDKFKKKKEKTPEDEQKEKDAKALMDKAIQIFDNIEKESLNLRASFYFENKEGYISSKKMGVIMESLISYVDEAFENGFKHSKLKDVKTYLQNSKEEIVAYKATIENIVKLRFGINAETVLGYICPIIEGLDQIQRSYENLKRKELWEKKVVESRGKFRQLNFVDQNEVDKVIDEISQVMSQIKKSNSLIENVNGIVRRFLVTYQSIPTWFCSLFTFYWNHRRFQRGKRKNLKPIEILTGMFSDVDWIDELLDGHVFEDEIEGVKESFAVTPLVSSN